MEHGQKVQYLTEKGEWAVGVIHAVSTQETADGIIKNQTFLIDTGRNTRVDEHRTTHFAHEFTKRLRKYEKENPDASIDERAKEIFKIHKAPDMPEKTAYIIKTRQPELIELTHKEVRPAE